MTEYKTLAESAEYSHIGTTAILLAIKRGKLKAEKQQVGKRYRWFVTQADLDEYRKNKFSRERLLHKGRPIYDIDGGRLGTYHAAKVLSELLGKPYPIENVYRAIKTGRMIATRCGFRWVIEKEEIFKVYEEVVNRDGEQMRFA
jgi:hypothetical protein